MDVQPIGSHFINGQYVKGNGQTIDDLFPATQETIAKINWATDAEIEDTIAAAKGGLEIWRNTSLNERARVLRKAADIIRERNDELAHIETYDTGKPVQETLYVDAVSGAECLEFFSAQAATFFGEHVGFSGDQGDWGYTRREPLGICVGIGAWNYPIQIACWKSAPALACGNAMIFKPAELTPLSALKLAEIYKEAGLPDGVFNVLQGDGRVGAALVAHPDVAKASLTGETSTGSKVLKSAADSIKKVTLELGGKSPLIIFEDADLDQAVGGALMANFYSTGQVCSNGTRVFVQRSVKEAFIQKLVDRTKVLKLGDPFDPETQIGPLVSSELYEKVMSYMAIGKSEAKLLIGGDTTSVAGFEKGNWVLPTIFDADSDQKKIVTDEIFGPLMSILTFDDEEEVIARANDTVYGLSAGVFTNDLRRAHRVIAEVQAGTCWINAYNLTPIELPFGGHKMSGIGRENGNAAMEHYSQIKSVYVAMNPVEAPY